jgi:hypothetical protein
MRMQEEQIRNVAKIFEAFARAVTRNENIKIEFLNDEGETTDFTIELNSDTPMIYFSLNLSGFINIEKSGVDVFRKNINDIQSVTTFRTTELVFSETENESENEEKDYSF